jgi:hypothetical protein
MGRERARLFLLLAVLLLAAGCSRERTSGDIRVQGPGVAPQLGFACCDQGLDAAGKLFALPGVVRQLQTLHATVEIPMTDFSPQRAALVRQLSDQGIPVVAGIALPADEGYYLNADNAPQAAARIAAFEQWSRANDLHWAAVGLDIEPNFGELEQLARHRWRLLATLARRGVSFGRMERARTAYAQIVAQIRAWGVPVQVYQMPYVPAERAAHTTLADRLLATPEVRGDQDYVMLYTSFARPGGAGVIWSLGRHAWGIAIGSTSGPGTPGVGFAPLDWSEFSRDLIVAGHFTPHVGVYNLEGCVRQGFLPRLLTLDWGETVVLPSASVQRGERRIALFRSVLWVASNLIDLLAAGLILAWLLWRWRARRRPRPSPEKQQA